MDQAEPEVLLEAVQGGGLKKSTYQRLGRGIGLSLRYSCLLGENLGTGQ